MNPFPTHRFWLGWTLLHAAVMGGTHWALVAVEQTHSFMFTAYPAVLVLALGQAVALRGRARWVWSWPVLAAGVGVVTFLFNWFLPVGLGLGLCLTQWPSLAAGKFRRTWLWPLLGGIAWLLGLLASWVIINPMRGAGFGGVRPPPAPLREVLALAVYGGVFGALTGYALALMRPAAASSAGTLYWDGDCPFCRKWVGCCVFIVRQGALALVPLQTEEARRALGLREGELPTEMKLRLADGQLLGGVDAYIVLAEAAGWTAPLGWLARLPGLNQLAWRAYRWIAANRYCLGAHCQLPAHPERRLP